jgi:DNA-binding MarR family transcriptional regulator
MAIDLPSDSDRERFLLEEIEQDPDITQANLAAQLGVAVGTVNWHLKRLVSKGYIKVKRAQRRKLRYIITPEGLAFRAMLTVNYIETSLRLYRNTRLRVRELVAQLRQAGYDQVYIEIQSEPVQGSDTGSGMSDIADICRLTCLEQGVQVLSSQPHQSQADNQPSPRAPVLEIHGSRVHLQMER